MSADALQREVRESIARIILGDILDDKLPFSVSDTLNTSFVVKRLDDEGSPKNERFLRVFYRHDEEDDAELVFLCDLRVSVRSVTEQTKYEVFERDPVLGFTKPINPVLFRRKLGIR